ncbi:MAG: 50S ribosomal protein L1 [Calditrichaeota bacterium]|nr:MAG: 50S ribosomal protein L1 [Calditrichota bacterium]
MKKLSRRRQEIFKLVDRTVHYSLEEGVSLVKKVATAKFDESIEISMNLNVDPKHADQIVRGTVALPNGTGKTVRVLVIAKGEKVDEATAAGADYVGLDEYVKKIQDGWFEFDVMIATPDVMGQIGKLGRALGPRGLMPNPKSGTVTFDVAKAVQEVKSGRIEFRCDSYGILHVAVGKASFGEQELFENVKSFIVSILKARPSVVKGAYVKSVSLSSTMGAGIKVDVNSAIAAAK